MTMRETEVSEQQNKALSLMPELMRQMKEYPHISGKEKGKRMLRRMCGKKNDPIDRFFWVHAMIAEALMQAHSASGDAQYPDALQEYADRYVRAGCPIYYIDQAMNGSALLYLHRLTGKKEYAEAADKLERFVIQSREETARQLADIGVRDDGGSIIYRKGNPTHIYADAIGMMCPFLMEKGIESARIAQNALRCFLQKGMDEETGLPYHGYDLKTGEKMGIIGWGRAVGWLLMGLAANCAGGVQEQNGTSVKKEAQTGSDEEVRTSLEGAYRVLAERTFAWQKEDGLFAWQLQAKQGPSDTSATAMILYAVKKGIRAGVLPKDAYEERAALCERGLSGCIREGKVTQCLAECRGFSQYPQMYGTYPWGTAMTAVALLARI